MYYDDLAKELLHHAKYERARSGIVEISELMAPLLQSLPADSLFVPVPTATSRVRQRGYDQAAVLAKELSAVSGLAKCDALARLGQAHQVGAGRKERLEHLKGAFRVLKPKDITGRHIILVDDVLTTGATLETAARLLKKSGAHRVDAIVFCQAG
ncbi:ComF family protein [Candidatus Saccharibacteria bacterium]|nr:MAG: ComF family protein [Candidatus Saccharibacteria bacterium]